MVHDNKSPRKLSPVRARATRSSLRYKPTARQTLINKETSPSNQASCSTIYTLNVSPHGASEGTLNNHSRLVSGVLHGGNSSGYHGESKAARSRNESLIILDKVEDMDIDHQSDHERDCLDSDMTGVGTTSGGTLGTIGAAAGMTSGRSLQTTSCVSKECDGEMKTERKFKRVLKQASEKDKFPPTAKEKKTSEIDHGPKIPKKKPIYIILHASLIRLGDITGKALSPIRIQAEKIIVEIEVKSDGIPETLKLRIPFKELATVQTNLSKPPYLLVVFINEKYSQSLVNGGKKNGVLNKMKGLTKLKMVIQLTYDVIPKDVKHDLDKLQHDLSADVQWEEISSSQATDIINGRDINNEETKIEHGKERKIVKGRAGNRKKTGITIQEQTVNEIEPQPIPNVQIENEKSPISSGQTPINENSSGSNTCVGKRILKRAYGDTTRPLLETDGSKVEEKVEEPKKDESLEENCGQSQVAPESSSSGEIEGRDTFSEVSGQEENERRDSLNCIHSHEQSFEENRLVARRIIELESSVAEKTGLLNQRRISVELRELQLEQERSTVRELRGSLREEQGTRRGIEARFDEMNGELVARNTSRMEEMERELCQLNISLTNVRTDNQRLVQEIHEVRGRMAENEATLTTERNTIIRLHEDLERERTTLEILREDVRQKDRELRQEQGLRTAVVEQCDQLEQTLTSTTLDYEQRIRRADEECTRVGRQYSECNRTLETTREELHDTNCALHRAQETIEEYSRMQPRDWTILRDEIQVSENVLGQGAWGWVKEGTFRGTQVAVKQMHELIISPHNRRLFEREMQMAARCRHPNLLQFIGATNDDGLALLVTELLDTNLRTVLGQRSLCQDEVLTLSLDVARGLNYLHLNKPFPIIHRDISSTNVLLWKREDTWHAKLSDYGAANFMRQCMTTSPGALIYAAPEAMTSQQSTKVDVYSFGLLLCEMCIRELPVPRHTNDQIRLITNGHLRDLVQRCTITSADNRPTMQEVLSALEHLCSNITLGLVSVNNRQVVL